MIYDIEQRSQEWFAVRRGKMTASHSQEIATAGKGLETYIYNIMAEKYSIAEKENYTNDDIERGVELENQARQIYELETGNEVQEVGFVELDEYTGASPDGLIGDDGLIEIKCHNDTKHFRLLIDGQIDKKYYWQMQMQMYVTDRQWCDYVAYNPNFEKSLIVIRIQRNEKDIEKLKDGLKKGKILIKQLTKKYEKQNSR